MTAAVNHQSVWGCSVPDCSRSRHARGLCSRHYMSRYKRGDLEAETCLRSVVPTAPLRAYMNRERLSINGIFGSNSARARAVHRPLIGIYKADDLACALGLHPIQIWPDWYELEGTTA